LCPRATKTFPETLKEEKPRRNTQKKTRFSTGVDNNLTGQREEGVEGLKRVKKRKKLVIV